ncbi:MAG: hypothetical protein JNK82_30815 [Myxococcaceae bacterium]|nr:hypothetical protein [Myxococcaceae bacterium]
MASLQLSNLLASTADPKALALAQGVTETALAQLHARGAFAHPGFVLEPRLFVAQLGRMLRRTGLAYPLESLNAGDLYLSAACLTANLQALEAFGKGPLKRALFSVRPESRDEVRQLVLEKLLLGPRPRLLEYSGQGALQVWLTLVVRRTSMNVGRSGTHEVHVAEPQDVRGAVAELLVQSPELQLGRKMAQAKVVAALKASLGSLDPKERDLLALHHLKGLPHDEIGVKLGAPRSTVAYWLTRARQKLLEGTRRRLAEALKLSDGELDSLVRAMGSRMDLSLALGRSSGSRTPSGSG